MTPGTFTHNLHDAQGRDEVPSDEDGGDQQDHQGALGVHLPGHRYALLSVIVCMSVWIFGSVCVSVCICFCMSVCVCVCVFLCAVCR